MPVDLRPLLLSLLAVAALALAGCGSRAEPTVALAMDGPSLFIMGEYQGQPVEGLLDRTVMAGVGTMTLVGTGAENAELNCTAKFDAPPTDKGRVAGFIDCGNGEILVVMLRNLGPDQGVGLAHAGNPEDIMIFFYHPSREEAERRLPGVLKDIAEARARKGK